jgi:hypothetical protein
VQTAQVCSTGSPASSNVLHVARVHVPASHGWLTCAMGQATGSQNAQGSSWDTPASSLVQVDCTQRPVSPAQG